MNNDYCAICGAYLFYQEKSPCEECLKPSVEEEGIKAAELLKDRFTLLSYESYCPILARDIRKIWRAINKMKEMKEKKEKI